MFKDQTIEELFKELVGAVSSDISQKVEARLSAFLAQMHGEMKSVIRDAEAARSKEPKVIEAPPAPELETKALIVSIREVCQAIGLCRTTLWKMERKGTFPRRRQLTTNRVGWLRSDVEAWLRNRPPGL